MHAYRKINKMMMERTINYDTILQTFIRVWQNFVNLARTSSSRITLAANKFFSYCCYSSKSLDRSSRETWSTRTRHKFIPSSSRNKLTQIKVIWFILYLPCKSFFQQRHPHFVRISDRVGGVNLVSVDDW